MSGCFKVNSVFFKVDLILLYIPFDPDTFEILNHFVSPIIVSQEEPKNKGFARKAVPHGRKEGGKHGV
jgi:hypothetical protein